MKRQLNRLSALRSIDYAIASGLDLNLLLSILLDRVIETLHVDAAAVLLLDPKLNELKFSAGKGFHTNILQHTRLKTGEGYAGKIALERKIVNITDITQNKTEFERSPLFPSERFVVYYGVPLIAKGRVLGVLEIFHRSYLLPDEDWLDFLNIISGQTAIAIDSAMMFKELQKSNFEFSMAYNATIDAWSRTLDLRDRDTEGHTRRVTDITLRFAGLTGLKDTDLIHVRRGATEESLESVDGEPVEIEPDVEDVYDGDEDTTEEEVEPEDLTVTIELADDPVRLYLKEIGRVELGSARIRSFGWRCACRRRVGCRCCRPDGRPGARRRIRRSQPSKCSTTICAPPGSASRKTLADCDIPSRTCC